MKNLATISVSLHLLWTVAVSSQNIDQISSTNTSDYVLLEEPHPCSRKCIQGVSMVCRYHFEIENYYTMSKACQNCPSTRSDCFMKDCIPGAGYDRGIISVNRRIPGPSIEVCLNDQIIVDVKNHLMSEGTTIHWHGQHQKETPYMDGVPYVTQCPIPPKTTFRYNFKATQAGTHFWHSHLGMQRVDGCYGPLVVRVPEESNPHIPEYDYDLSLHTMILIDWERITGMEKFLYHHHSVGDNKPATLLINGMGNGKEFVSENKTIYTPLARFPVEYGYRYRFRVINAGFLNCPIEMSVDNHTIQVISSDGADIVPVKAESLVTYAGERFDFVLTADQPKNLYWIRFRGLMDCDERFNKAHQSAVLEYKGFDNQDEDYQNRISQNDVTDGFAATNSKFLNDIVYMQEETLPQNKPDWDNSYRTGKQINSLNKGTEANQSHITMPELSALQKWDHSLKFRPDYQIFLAYDFYKLDNKHFHRPGYEFYNVTSSENQLLTPQLNHISMEMPSFPLLSQRDEIPDDMFCNENTIKGRDCADTYCECPHAYQIPLNAVVELIIIDEGFTYDANHPLHLHGYAFRVVAMEKVGDNVTVAQVKQRDRKGQIKRNLFDPPVKDTVNVPDGGYTVVRFHATNPGYWIFHCHLEMHAEIGMALIFKVGENSQMPKVPVGFPRCGNYIPIESTTQNQTSDKPDCSRSALLNRFEKLIFGDYCEDVPTSSGKTTLHSSFLIVISVLVLVVNKNKHV
ncbi:unnamed protein product [Ceutorhynchus assimilis]|uniref:Uncharacterized protein n=1 Tax=Ceutorhynchus assimilis TaxID=467358 RepID=A0A9N9N0S0_9CUCU|nr:unnamed protein product [Ceutorhynchus assimilis]